MGGGIQRWPDEMVRSVSHSRRADGLFHNRELIGTVLAAIGRSRACLPRMRNKGSSVLALGARARFATAASAAPQVTEFLSFGWLLADHNREPGELERSPGLAQDGLPSIFVYESDGFAGTQPIELRAFPHSLDKMRPRGCRVKPIGEILRFVGDQPFAEFHDAHRVRRYAVIG